MLPTFAAYRSSVTQTEEVLINKCLAFGKSIGTQTEYTAPYHVTIATQTLKHHIDQDIGSVFGLEMSVERTLKHKDNDSRFCGLSKNDKGSDTRVRDVIDLESDMDDDSDPPYSPDFEECFESDHLIDDESDNDKGTGRRKFSGKKTSLVQHQISDKNESSVKDVVNSELHLGKTNSTLVTSSEDLNEVNMIKVNLVQIVDKNGEKKLQMVLTKPDCHGNIDSGPVSKALTNKIEIPVNNTAPKAKSHDNGDSKPITHVQTNQIGNHVNNSSLKLNSEGNKTTKVLSQSEGNVIGNHATNPKLNDTKNTKLVSLLHKNLTGVPVSPLKSNTEGNKNTKLISLLPKNQKSLLVNHSPSKSISDGNTKTKLISLLQKDQTEVLKNDSTTKSYSDCNKNAKPISLLQKGTSGSISEGQGTKSLEDINDGDNNCVSLSESKNVIEKILCNPQNDAPGLKEDNSTVTVINPESNEGSNSSMWKQILNVGSQVELQECDKTNMNLNQMEQQDESQIDIQKEDQIELETSQIETQFEGQSQVHHVELHITTHQIEQLSGDQAKLHTGIEVELPATSEQIDLQEENPIYSQVENQLELQTKGQAELQTDQVVIQTGDEIGLKTGHLLDIKTFEQQGSQLQLQLEHTELQEAVSQIEMQVKDQNVSQTESQTELQLGENENFNRQCYNEVTEQTNSQYLYCEEKENVNNQMTCAIDENKIIYTQDGNYILVNQNVIDGYQNYEIIDGAGMDGSVFKVLSVQEPIEIEMVNDTENEIIEYGTGSEFVHNYCKKTTTKTRQSRKKGTKSKSKCRVEGTDINAEVEFSKLNANKGQGKNKSCVRKQKELKEEKPMPSLQCEFCGECFLSEARLDRHVAQEHSDKRIWKCEFCDRVYRRRKGLKTHVQTHVKEPTHECSICAKKCLTLWQLKVHLKTHDKTKQFQCKHCDKAFKSPSAYRDHEITHELSNEELYVIPCNSCNKKFQNQQKLKLHIQRMHSPEITKFKCDFCEKCFSMKGNLNTHLRTHTKERPFQCKFCTKSFTLKCTLLEHEKRHQGIKNFSCDECDMCFVNKSSLNAHKLSHSDVKKYKCEVCGLGLKSKVNLNMHMRIHSGEKPFSCTQCSKSFRTKFVLKKHMRSHTGEKLPPKFPCDICGKLFITSYNRKIHRMIHTGDKPFICESCGQKFSTQAFLNSHMKTCDDANVEKTKRSTRITQKTASKRKSTT